MKLQAVGTHLVVMIDRQLQKDQVYISPSGLIPSPQYEHMQYLLQMGTIISIGEEITNPEIKVGRRAILHHLVESEDKYLLHEYDNGDQLRWLNSVSMAFNYKLYGVLDSDNNIIPLETFVFCEPEPQIEEGQQYERLEFQTEQLQFLTEKVGSLYVAKVPEKVEEKKYVKVKITHIAPTEKFLKPGMLIIAEDFTRYPIKILGREYWVISREFVLSIQHPPAEKPV